jgi:hypothetical protein
MDNAIDVSLFWFWRSYGSTLHLNTTPYQLPLPKGQGIERASGYFFFNLTTDG